MISRRFIVQNPDQEIIADLFLKYKLGKKVEVDNVRCKHCLIFTPLEEADIRNNFWKCPKGHNNKFNKKYIVKRKYFEFDFSDIIRKFEKKLNSKNIQNYKAYLIFHYKSKEVPIFFFDIPTNSSLFFEGLKKGAFFVYFDVKAKEKCETAYNKTNFIHLYEFFNKDKKEIIRILQSIANSIYPLETLKINRKINKFIRNKNFEKFEKEVTAILNDLKNNEQKITNLLDLCCTNRTNPTGYKFVHIGGNDPLDIYPIELFSYLNGVLETSSDKGYDAKMFSDKLTYQKYKEKKESNSGRKLVFITSTSNIDNKIWKDIKKAKENSGDWFYFVLDLDLLSLILYYIGNKKYFN